MNDQIKFLPVNIAILTISDSRNEDTDISGKTLIDKVNNAGHNVINYSIVEDSIEKIRKTVLDWTKKFVGRCYHLKWRNWTYRKRCYFRSDR